MRDPQKLGVFEKAGVWLGVWTAPKGVEVQRPSRRQVAIASALVVALLAVLAALVVPPLESGKRSGAERRAAAQRAVVKREEAHLRADQRLHLAGGRRPAGADSPALRRRARPQLEAAITRDARSRVAHGTLQGPVSRTECEPSTDTEETNLKAPTGIYKCLVVTNAIQGSPTNSPATVGYPFVATVTYRDFGFAWCKENPQPGEKAGPGLAHVRLSRRCAGRLRDVL